MSDKATAKQRIKDLGKDYSWYESSSSANALKGIKYKGSLIIKTRRVGHIAKAAEEIKEKRINPEDYPFVAENWSNIDNYGKKATTNLPLESIKTIKTKEEKEKPTEFLGIRKDLPLTEKWWNFYEKTSRIENKSMSEAVQQLMPGHSYLIPRDYKSGDYKYVVRDEDRSIIFKARTNKELLQEILDHITAPAASEPIAKEGQVNPLTYIKEQKEHYQARINKLIEEFTNTVGGEVEVQVEDNEIKLKVKIIV